MLSDEATEIGLVNKVVPQAELMDEVITLAEQIMKNAPLAVEKSKQLINDGLDMPLVDGLRKESDGFGSLFATEDQKTGAKAFINKEKATFKRK